MIPRCQHPRFPHSLLLPTKTRQEFFEFVPYHWHLGVCGRGREFGQDFVTRRLCRCQTHHFTIAASFFVWMHNLCESFVHLVHRSFISCCLFCERWRPSQTTARRNTLIADVLYHVLWRTAWTRSEVWIWSCLEDQSKMHMKCTQAGHSKKHSQWNNQPSCSTTET